MDYQSEQVIQSLVKLNEATGKLLSTALNKGAELEKEVERLRQELAECKRL